jgi:hypothetical protein
LVIGAQRAAEPTPTTGFQRQCLQGSECFLDERAAPERPLRLEFQDVGVDPGLCRKVGNETYCY